MPSALLIINGVPVALVIGIPLAVTSALKPRSLADNSVLVMTTFPFAMPQFWLGLVLALLLVTILSDMVYRPWSLEGDKLDSREMR